MHSPRLPSHIARRLRLPLVAAPMLAVSGVELVVAACRNGVIGAFPTANARSVDELDRWLTEIERRLFAAPEDSAPCCPTLVMRSPRLAEDLACLLAHRVELVITSVGSPAPAVAALHGIGCGVWADVATLAHARKAIAAGVDGLVVLSAGAGGQTGWLNPLAFVRALRAEYDGPLVLAGGVGDGVALRLTDPTVSRFHCEVVAEAGGLRVLDLESRNGTVLDGVVVRDARVDWEDARRGAPALELRLGAKLGAIREAIREADGLVLLLTPASIGSDWVQREAQWALETKLERPGFVLLPLLRQGRAQDVQVHTRGEAGQLQHPDALRPFHPVLHPDCRGDHAARVPRVVALL